MNEFSSDQHEQLWIELPPVSGDSPKRLLIFVHSAQTTAEQFLPVAIHWQLRFPTAIAIVLHDPLDRVSGRQGWVSSANFEDSDELVVATEEFARRVASAQKATKFTNQQTTVIAHGVGATVLLESLRRGLVAVPTVVTYAGRIVKPIRSTESISTSVHLVHGQNDTIVSVDHARRTLRGLQSIHCDVTLDIAPDGTHWMDQDMINLGTSRVMRSIFKGRTVKNLGGQTP
jgi:phospholipase/carboxylesterase